MATLKDKLVTLQGLDYFNRNAPAPHQSSITMMAEAMQLLTDWINNAESRLNNLEYNAGGSVSLASMFQIGLNDEYYIQDESEAPDLVASGLNLDGMAVPIGTSKVEWRKPTVSIDPITWPSEVDSNYDFVANATVRVTFGEAGTLSKTVIFKKPGPGKVYAVTPMNGAYIDTGIQGDYSYRYHMKGHSPMGNQAVLLDAFVSTTERATVRIMGSSNKIQVMWPSNKEVTSGTSGINFRNMFEITVGSNFVELAQDGKTYSTPFSGHTSSGSIGSNIYILDSAASGFGFGTLSFGEILNSDGEQIAYFAPYRLSTDEVIFINTTGITAQQIYDIVQNGDAAEMASHIYRPASGYFRALTQAEDIG